MNKYLKYVKSLSTAFDEAVGYELGGIEPCAPVKVAADAPKVMIFSPHPDDECLIGGLALRLLRESKWQAINVPVTLGSNKDRKLPRLEELTGAMNYLGIEIQKLTELGFDRINPAGRENDKKNWAEAVVIVADKLLEQKPELIVFPHEKDWNSSHIGVYYLITEALATLSKDFTCRVLLTQFWGEIYNPNVMVEISDEDLADLVAATTFHAKEVERNPYHLCLPAMMLDAVRRGGEVVGGQGGEVPSFRFATNYLLKEWKNGELVDCLEKGLFIGKGEDPAALILK